MRALQIFPNCRMKLLCTVFLLMGLAQGILAIPYLERYGRPFGHAPYLERYGRSLISAPKAEEKDLDQGGYGGSFLKKGIRYYENLWPFSVSKMYENRYQILLINLFLASTQWTSQS